MADDESNEPIQPQRIDLNLQVSFNGSKTFDSQWIEWAQTTDAPQIAGVDASLNPQFTGDPNDPNADGGTAYA